MKKYTLENWSTGAVKIITAISWSIESYQHMFYSDEGGKIVCQSYSTRYWDLVDVEEV